MIRSARPSSLSFIAHAVDDAGALCGARPGDGRWRPTTRFPINCPRCLYKLASVRYAVAETPSAAAVSLAHVRLVGPEGISKGGYGHGAVKALCGTVLGWDLGPLSKDEVAGRHVCAVCIRLLDSANAVR